MYYLGAYITDPAVGGPHWITIEDGTACDNVTRLGMLAGTEHCHLDLEYKWGKTQQSEPVDPMTIIMPMAEKMLGAMPANIEWALPAAADRDGFSKQVGGHWDEVIDGVTWNCQTFSRPTPDNYPEEETEYRVYACLKGEWDKIIFADVVRD